MNHTTRLLLLAATFCTLLACLPSLTQSYVILEEEDFEEPDAETEWKRGYGGRVIPDPVPRAPMTKNLMSRYLQNLASRRFVSDSGKWTPARPYLSSYTTSIIFSSWYLSYVTVVFNSLFATYKSPVCHIILEHTGMGASFWKYFFQLAVSLYL